jgi:two-component system response regulator PhoP
MRVLVIEDEDQLRAQISTRLEKEGYAVDQAGDGVDGHFMGMEYPLDVAVVDLGLPEMPGIEVISKWRAAGRTFPILILTARDRWQDKVDGLEAGADDYLVKPFNNEELLARLRALVRRSAGWTQNILESGPIRLDTRSQQVECENRTLELTAFEYKLLEYLILHAGKVISKTELAEHVYAEDLERDSNVIEVVVGRLRKKLDPDQNLKPIETLRGRGYRLRSTT